MTSYSSLFVDGDWRQPSSSEVITVISPATEQAIGHAPCGAEADVDAAVAAARHALTSSGWAQWQPSRRAEAMERLADALEKRAQATAALVSSENGMPISLSSVVEGIVPAGVLRYYAALARTVEVEEVASHVRCKRLRGGGSFSMLMVGVGSDSFGFGSLPDVEKLADGDDVPAAGAAASFGEAAGDQVALRAAALSGGPVTAAGAFVDAAGCPRSSRGQRW